MSQNDDAPVQEPDQQAVQQPNFAETDELSDDQLDTISGGVGSASPDEEEETVQA